MTKFNGREAHDTSFMLEEPRPTTKLIIKEILRIAVPNMMSFTLDLVNELTNTVVLGHSGSPSALAAVGLGNMMQNCFGLSIGFGISGALDTLVSQAYGAGRNEATAVYLQRCRLICTLQLVWIIPVMLYSTQILTFMHQDPTVARYAGEYNRAAMWGLFAAFQFDASMKFLANRKDAMPAVLIGFVTSLFHVGWSIFFVWHCGWLNAGAGYANCVTLWSRFVLISIYFAFYAKKAGLTRKSLLWIEAAAWREWKEYCKFAIPSVIQLATEWWFWEICALFVGYLGETVLAAHVSSMNFATLAFTPIVGLQSATATLSGNALGANLPRKTRKTCFTCLCADLCTWAVIACLTVFFRHYIASAYTASVEVQEVIERLLCIYAITGFADSQQSVMSGALRGLGLQRFASITYIVAYYVVMLPLGLVWAFKWGAGVDGIWYSSLSGTVLAATVFAIRLRSLNYPKLAHDTVKRLEAEERADIAAVAAAEASKDNPSTLSSEPATNA